MPAGDAQDVGGFSERENRVFFGSRVFHIYWSLC